LVQKFRRIFCDDPGLDGCLLELEEILKLKISNSMEVCLLLRNNDGKWVTHDCSFLPPKNVTSTKVFKYHEQLSKLIVEELKSLTCPTSWHLIQVPSGFDVIDAVLVHISNDPTIYAIQITRSAEPFSKHYTLDTCPAKSQKRLDKLWQVISNEFNLNFNRKFFVMVAPNCGKNKFIPPAGDSSAFYFSPLEKCPQHENPRIRKKMRSIYKT
jgi:hypothetical protein